MLPFSIFLRGGRPCYYVAFKNEDTGKYLPAVSTKKIKKSDAERQAWVWYREGIPKRNGKSDIKTLSLHDSIRHIPLTTTDAELIVDELKRKGLVLSCILAGAASSVRLSDFLLEFWDWDRSPYIREKLRAEHSIHKNYVSAMSRNAKMYWLPFFDSRLLGELVPGDVDCFVDHLSGLCHCNNKDLRLSNPRKNVIIKSGIVPLRWAYKKRILETDITRDLILFSTASAERIILTPEQAAAVFVQDWPDIRTKVANMTAMVTGLRAGELQGLQFDDIGDGFLRVRHSWNRLDKLKPTKTNIERIVELPFPSVLQSLRYVASLNPHKNSFYVFWSDTLDNKPMEQRLFLNGLRGALIASGLTETVAAGYSFHAWRHFFTTYMRPKLDDKLLQSQTGHKSEKMLEHYSDHVRPGDRDKIREAQLDVFSSLLPQDEFSS